jgi:hypothetical protein
MEMDKKDNRLLEWTINKAKTEFKDDICFMLEHGKHTLPEDSQVRFISGFVSNADHLIGMARTFIINGIGYDYWQREWKDFERIADIKDYYTCSLADAKLVYYKDEEDKQRFLYLQAKLRKNLDDPKYMYERGLEWLDKAMDIYKTLLFEEALCNVRMNAGFIADRLSVAVACVNQKYFDNGVIAQIEPLSKMEYVPENFVELYKKIVRSQDIDELKSLSHEMLSSTKKFFKAQNKWVKNAQEKPDYQELAFWYQEGSYYFHRLYCHCRDNQPENAFHQCINLQPEFNFLMEDFKISDLDLLSNFDADNLAEVAACAKIIEQRIISEIEGNGVTIEIYPTLEDFLEKNE